MDARIERVALNVNLAKPANRGSARVKSMRSAEWLRSEETADAHRRDRKLGFLLHDVSRMRRKAFDQFMKPLGITRAQWWVIAHLSRQDGMMQTQLADILEVSKTGLGNLIDRLEATEWVKRGADPTDKRVKRVYLARKSQQLLDNMRASERAFNEHVLRGLTGNDREILVQLLTVIKQSLPEMDLGEFPTDA